MSDNLSIEELLKRAEEIKAEAERQLAAAEHNLQEKANLAIDRVDVVSEDVRRSVEEKIKEEPDVKEYVPKSSQKSIKEKTQTIRFPSVKKPKDDEDVKIAPAVDDKTRTIVPEDRDDKVVAKKDNTDGKTRPMVFSSNPKVDESGDLQSIPTIVSREHIYDGFDGAPDEEIGVQISFDGFEDTIDEVQKIDENVAEQLLEQRRREKVGKFRLFGPDETDMDLGNNNLEDEYEDADQKADFLSVLMSKKYSVSLKLIATVLLGVPMLLMALFKDSSFFPTALSGHTAFFVIQLVLLAATVVVNYNVFIHGFNLKRGLTFDLSVSVMSLVVLAHTVACMCNDSLWIDNGVLLTPIASFGLFMSQLGKHRMMSRVIDNFEFITHSKEQYTVENIANRVDADVISRGVIEGDDAVIKTSVKTDFATNFLEISCKDEPANRVSVIVGGVMALLSVILMIVLGIIDDINTGINVAACSFCVSIPVSALFLTNSVLGDISSGLDKFGSRVCGFEGAEMASSGDAMVMSGADLFGKNSCDLLGIKTFNNAKVDEAIILAAAVMIQTNSPLAHVFDDVIIGKQSILPKVEGITYEDKMGTSAWIYGRKVLVGNRDLLRSHGCSVPKESFEQKYSIKDRKALYLAVNGRIMAMFVVAYSADPDLKRELRKLEKTGITVIVKSCDPYINEESLAQLYSLPMGFIRVMNHSSARVYDKYSNLSVERSPAYVVHNGTAKGFVSAMRAAGIIVSSKALLSFLLSFGSVLGFCTVTVLAFVGGLGQISTFSILSFQIIWGCFVAMVSKIKHFGL